MGRIDDIFASLRSEGKKGLMPFVVGGHPAPGGTGALLAGLERGGASVVEVGFPFSDPIADGPVIASAMDDAIRLGATPQSVLEEVRAARSSLSLGLVAMVSVSIVERLGGAEAFVGEAVEAGFDGFIFPDAPLEESGALIDAAASRDASVSLLVSPTTPDGRAGEIARACRGFIYVLARAGITGERTDAPDVSARVAVLREATATPIAVGFGVSDADQVRAVVAHADAAIVGSALVRRLSGADDPSGDAERFTRELASGLA